MKGYFESLVSWHRRVRESGLPVVLYGMGNGAERMLALCRRLGIEVSGVFASDDFVRGQSFCGYRVTTLAQAEAEHGKMAVLLGFGTDIPEIMERIDRISQKHLLLAPELSVIGEDAFDKDRFLGRFDRAERVYGLLQDEESRRVFRGLTAYKITGELKYLREVFSDNDKSEPIIPLGRDEVYCDLGAYNGDTVAQFVERAGSWEHIYALEPEKRNFQKCVRRCAEYDRITLVNAAAWSHDCELGFKGGQGRQASLSDTGGTLTAARSLDSLLSGRRCTYIKYDVEGADIPALEGSAETIRKYRPKLCCAVYHRCYDYIDIPLYLEEMCPGYRMFLRQSPYYPAWETCLYAL